MQKKLRINAIHKSAIQSKIRFQKIRVNYGLDYERFKEGITLQQIISKNYKVLLSKKRSEKFNFKGKQRFWLKIHCDHLAELHLRRILTNASELALC